MVCCEWWKRGSRTYSGRCSRYTTRFAMTASRDFLSFADRTNSLLRPAASVCLLLSELAALLDTEVALFPPSNGALSSTTCAFVPPKPKLFTDTYFFPLGHGLCALGTVKPHSFQGILLFGNLKSWFGRMNPRSSISAALITAATPDAASRCPMLDFTEPMKSGSRAVRVEERAAWMAPASVGSPILVPVPCASTKPQSLGSAPAAA